MPEDLCFATALAKLCHHTGKTLPLRWQNFANAVAEVIFLNR